MIKKEAKHIFRILILLFVISSFIENGYANKDKPDNNKVNQTSTTHKYFKHLVFRETPYAPLQGRNPLPAEVVQKENHYKFTYNQQNQLIKLAYKYGEQTISTLRAGMMDGSTNIAPLTNIQYDKNLEIRHFFDEQGNPSVNNMNVHKAVYEYNDKGERVGLKYYDKDNKLMDNSWGICEYIWEKIDDNKVLEKRKNTKGEYVPIRPYYQFMNVIYEYHPNGMLASMKNVDDTGKLIEEETGVAVDEPIYDEKLQLTSFKFYDANGKNVVGSFLGSAGGTIIYDDKGSDIEFAKTDLEGNPTLGTGVWAFIKQKYDEFGNLTERSFFDEKGKPAAETDPSIDKPFTKIEFIYNKENLAIKPERVFYD